MFSSTCGPLYSHVTARLLGGEMGSTPATTGASVEPPQELR